MQRDDAQNPAMLWVADGEALWNTVEGDAKKSCANCHGEASKSMRGVAARFPTFSPATKKPINLQQRINQCRTTNQSAPTLPLEHQTLLNLETYIARQSRGDKLAQSLDPKLNPARKLGETLFSQRMGQLDLSCKDCHQTNAGKRLGGNTIPQAHPTGYPLYRLEWQAVGSLAVQGGHQRTRPPDRTPERQAQRNQPRSPSFASISGNFMPVSRWSPRAVSSCAGVTSTPTGRAPCFEYVSRIRACCDARAIS